MAGLFYVSEELEKLADPVNTGEFSGRAEGW
jgi:hypothetical protein